MLKKKLNFLECTGHCAMSFPWGTAPFVAMNEDWVDGGWHCTGKPSESMDFWRAFTLPLFQRPNPILDYPEGTAGGKCITHLFFEEWGIHSGEYVGQQFNSVIYRHIKLQWKWADLAEATLSIGQIGLWTDYYWEGIKSTGVKCVMLGRINKV